jgi:hypothetical protein
LNQHAITESSKRANDLYRCIRLYEEYVADSNTPLSKVIDDYPHVATKLLARDTLLGISKMMIKLEYPISIRHLIQENICLGKWKDVQTCSEAALQLRPGDVELESIWVESLLKQGQLSKSKRRINMD